MDINTRNWRYILVMLVVRAFYMPGALAISFSHILTAGHMLGLTGWQAWTAPFFIDGFALIGMVMRSRTFDADVRRFGLRLQIAAGVGSLAANVAAGHTLGERIYGALVVVGLVVAELAGERVHAGRRRAAAAPATVEVIREVIVEVPAPAPVVDETEVKRAARRERDRFNRAVKAAAAKLEADRVARDAELLEMAAGFVPADAPVSPAPGEAAAYL